MLFIDQFRFSILVGAYKSKEKSPNVGSDRRSIDSDQRNFNFFLKRKSITKERKIEILLLQVFAHPTQIR